MSTGLGSTAWMKSIITGARAIAAGLGGGSAALAEAYAPLA